MKNSRRSPSSGMRLCVGFCAAFGLSLSFALVQVAAQTGQGLPVPIPGRNVNMVSGTTLPGGDPFLQRQNEPSISVSTRNPLHLFGASNDYRTVDIPGLGEEVTGDAWIGIFKSFDGGSTWKSSLLPGFRQDVSEDGIHSPLFGLQAAADPVIRAGTNGLFYMGGMAFNRDQDDGKVFVARYIDNNNREAGDSISYLGTTVIDTGSATRFLDKPWIVVDIPRAMKGNAKPDKNDHPKDDKDKGKDKNGKVNEKEDRTRRPTTGPVCQIPGQAQPIPAGTIYVMYSAFLDPVGGSANLPPRVDREEEERERGESDQRKRRERENGEDHTPGQPMEGRTLIMLSRSTDCGRTFSRPARISERSQINQGSVAAIDPNTGTIYVAWREFLSSAQPDAILLTKSTDGGNTFSSPIRVALIHPFDQASSATKFRTNSYPTMTVDATGRIYVAWAERGIGPIINGQGGDARIVISTSTDGRNWSAPQAADNPQQRGHQFMPVLSFGGGKLHLVWWDQRDDRSQMWGTFIDEAPILNWVGAPASQPTRHTIDLRGAQGLPGAPPQFGPSVRVSNYLEGVRAGRTEPEQLQFNAPNLPLFALGTTPFIGDYLDVSTSPAFIANGDGTWRYNTLPADPSLYFTSWSDNRDVRKPADGNWVHYTPPTFAGYTGTSIFDPTQPVEVCSQGQAGMRDQNVYSSRVQSGLVMTTLGNTKPLGFVTAIDGTRQLIQRTFVVTVSNPDPPVRQPDGTITGFKDIVLHINAQPVGGRASFLQFEQLIDLPVRIAPRSSVSRDVFVTSTDRNASVPVTVTEGTATTTSAKIIINPDITNPDIENPDIENPDIENPDIENAEAHAITVSNPDITNPDIENLARANPDIENPDIENPDIENPDIENPDITNPDIINPDIENPDIENPDIENPDIENPDIENPDIENAALTDVTWNVSNVGNTATSYQVKLLLKQAQQQRLVSAGVKFQLVVTRTTASPVLAKDLCAVASPNRNMTVVTINSPTFIDPSDSQQFSAVVNPDIENPDIENATVALAPGDTARVTLRVYSPVGDTTEDPNPGTPVENPLGDLTGALEDLRNLGVVTTSHPVDTIAVQQGSTTPAVAASIPIIVTTTLPDASRTVAYTATIVQTGSTPPFSFAVTTGSLPPGLTLLADGHIVGTPTASGVFTFTVRLLDANEQEATATLIIRVFEPIIVATGALSGAVVNQSFSTMLSASGGFPPLAWSVTGGALPTGATLSGNGVLSGTPTQSGTFAFTAQAMDVADPSKFAASALVLNVTPTANAQSVNVVEDTATAITVSGTGAAQGAFTFAIGNQPAHGTVTGTGPAFSYTPASNYSGPDSFTFRVTQGSLTSAFATVTINVTAANDLPVATPQTVNTPQGVNAAITLTGTDAENSPLTFAILTQPTSGTLTGTAPNVVYHPVAGFTGTATFTFRVTAGGQNSAPATVSVIVGPPPTGSADVTLTLLDAPDPATIGGNITYTATLHNNGPATANAVSFTLEYPAADLQRVSVTPSQGTCGTANPIICTVGAIVSGGNVSIPVVLRAFNRGGTFAVTSSTSTGAQLDYNTSNNAASQSTLVNGPATPSTDLHVQQNSAPNPVVSGGNTVYTIVVANNGPSDATGVSLTNTFTSATAQFVSATASQGSCSSGGSQVSCNVGGLINGAFATYTVTLRASGGGSLSNTAVVTGSQSDPSAADNSSTLATTISNRAPVANNDVATVNEDAPAATISVLSNDTDADGDTLTVTGVTPGENTHGTVQVVGTNAVSYTPASNYNGAASFGYAISDGHGGTANATVNVTVLSVNDAPSFVRGPNQSTGENSGAQTVPGWATAIAAGPAGATEGSQTVSFIVSNDNHFLFSSQPTVSPTGTLTYTAAPSGTGTATVTISAQDNGGTDNGGVDSSASQTFTIAIGATNDAPSFTAGPSQTIPQGAPLQTVPNWATFISAGPPDESGQLIDFIVTNNNNPLFISQPSVSPTGTLTYQAAANAFGSATVTVRAHDNGGTTPGVDTSAPQTFLITVTPAAGAATFVVANTNDAGPGTLRQAIVDSNLNTGFTNTIRFQIGTGPVTIAPLTALPTITVPVVIDGTTQPGFTGAPIVELDGTNAGEGANGLQVGANQTTVRGFVINRFQQSGIVITGTNNVVAGNYIGIDASGTADRGNGVDGIRIVGAGGAVVGGVTVADRNVISGNANSGIFVSGPGAPVAPAVFVKGNIIGLDATGNTGIGNDVAGVQTANAGVQVGDIVPGARNIISGNLYGIAFSNSGSTFDSVVYGNYIGTDITGLLARGNASIGVLIGSAPGTRVGGDVAGAGNVISGNAIGLSQSAISHPVINGTYHSVVQGNIIGFNANLTAALPNSLGVSLGNSDNLVGGATAGAPNTIAGNTAIGVSVVSGTGNAVTRNVIHSNGGLGIDLAQNGVSANDAGDSDAGANGLQNFPVLSSAINNGGASTTVIGTLNSTPNSAFVVDLYSNLALDPTGFGEGQTYLGSVPVTTDGAGNAAFAVPVAAAVGAFITSTATDASRNTSEFSAGVVVTTAPTTADLDVSITDSQDPVAPGAQYSYSVSIHNAGPGNATGVVFTLNVSPNVTVHAIGGPGTCEQTAANQYTCGTGAIANGASVLYGIATSASWGTATATASVTSLSTDPNQANNTAQQTTTINRPPTAVADNATTASAVAVEINVLANDTDPDVSLGDVLHITSIGVAAHGIVSTTTGSPLVRYTPAPGFTGIDTFNYSVGDTAGSTSALTTVTVLVSQAVCAAEPSGLVSWWPGSLDVTATDIRGGNNGTPQGAVSQAPGIVGSAFSFNRSVGSGILVPNAANLNPSQITLAAWVKPAAVVEDYQSIIRKTGSYALALTNNAYAVCEIGSAFLAGGSVPAGQWSHVVCTYDGIALQLYVNGTQVTSLPTELGIPLNTTALMIGGDAIATHNEFNGLIDEVQIFSRALPIEDILTIINAGDAGLCSGGNANTTDDSLTALSGTAATFYPSSNDTIAGEDSPAVLATVRAMPAEAPVLTGPGDVAIVNSTGLAYFTGGPQSLSMPGKIGILNTNTNTLVGAITLPVGVAASLVRVNQTTQIVYMRVGGTLLAIDGRPGSPTFNTSILALTPGTIQSMALDEVHSQLYLTVQSGSTTGAFQQARLVAVDVDPSSPTFHQIVFEGAADNTATSLATAQSLGVNPVTNKLYIAIIGGADAGVNVIGLVDDYDALVANTSGASTLVVNPVGNLVYAISGSNLFTIDGATDTRIATLALPANATSGALDSRIAVHTGTGRVYVRLAEFPAASRLLVIDGKPFISPGVPNPAFNTILATLSLGREDGQTQLAIDEVANRLIATSRSDLKSTVINTTTNTVVGTVQATQNVTRVAIDSVHHRAYLSSSVGYIQVVDLATGTELTTVPVGVETTFGAVNTLTHTAYVPGTDNGTFVALVNATGLVGGVGLPHNQGRMINAVRNSVTNRIYTVNGGATAGGGSDALPGFVNVIDGATNNVIANVPVGPLPFQALAVNETTNKVYVGSVADGAGFPSSITVIDGVTNTTVQADLSLIPQTSVTPGVIGFNRDFVVNPATNKVYVRITANSTATMGVLDGNTNVVTALPNVFGAINMHVVNPVLNRVYIAGTNAAGVNEIHVLNGANDQEIATIGAGFPSNFVTQQSYMAVNRVTGRLFVANFSQDSLAVINGANNTVVANILVGDGPSAVAVNETLNRIYVGNTISKTMMIIDGTTLRVVSTIPLPLAPLRLLVDESAGLIFVMPTPNEPGAVVVSDPGTNAPAVTTVSQGAHGTVVLNADGSVTYTANAGYTGADSYTYTISDGSGGSATGTVNLTVRAPLTITTASLANTSVGSAYAQTIVATGGTGSHSFVVSSGLLPGGLQLNGFTGALTGEALQSGTFAFVVQSRDSAIPPQVAAAAYVIIVGPPSITTFSLSSASLGTPYSQQVTVGGATGVVAWTLNTFNSPLLTWLSISNAGVLSGTPPAYGTTPSFTVTATDALNQVASRSFTIGVGGPLDITPTELREGIVLETQSAVPLVGGNGTRVTSITSGALPPGLVLTSSGSFTGTPTRHGSFTFSVEARDCTPSTTCIAGTTQQVVTRNLTLRVSAKDQQGGAQTQTPVTFGGPGGRRVAQTVTVGAQGTLTGIGLQNITCSSLGPVTIDIQRLTSAGLPDGNTIATGTATANFGAITVAPAIAMAIDSKFAFVVSSSTACTLNNAPTTDVYQAGEAYVDAGGGWVSFVTTDGRYDVPSFRSLIQPAMDVTYLNRARNNFQATLLGDNRVLLTGNNLTAEIYDPVTKTTTLTGNMALSRNGHTATLLVDGTVLIAGGSAGGVRQSSAEIYDPNTGLFTATVGQMSVPHENHTATRLNDGRVLIAGGFTTVGTVTTSIATAEIYDPVLRTFSPTGSMVTARQQHSAVKLGSGAVVIFAGYTSGTFRSAEIYNPTTGIFTGTVGNMIVNRGRTSAAVLADGRVLITGGQVNDIVNTAEIYDPITDSFAATGSMSTPRYNHTSTTLPDGSVLVAGGFDQPSAMSYILPLASMERWLPGSATFVPAGGMETRRANFNAIRVLDDTVLLVGGPGQGWMSADTAELYIPAAALSLSPTTLPNGTPGVAYGPVTFAPIGGTGPYVVTSVAGSLPPGMTFTSGTRTLAGTPTAVGVFTLGFQIADSANHVNVQTLTLRVGSPNTITSPYRLLDAGLGLPYSVQLTASGTAPIVWFAGPPSGLPSGLTMSSTGLITGTPDTLSFFNFAVRAVDANGQQAIKTFGINVVSPLLITTTAVPEAAFLENYNPCISASGGNGTRSYSVSAGALPPGVSLLENGCFTSSPTALGTYAFTARVTDQSSPPQVVTSNFSLRVSVRDQQGNSQSATSNISFGGPGGRRLAQSFTAGANGTLTAVGSFNISCPTTTTVTMEIQSVLGNGAPSGTVLASGSAVSGLLSGVAITPAIPVTIGSRFAIVLNSALSCNVTNAPTTTEGYLFGDGYADTVGGWSLLTTTDGRTDIPVRTLIQPEANVGYLRQFRSSHNATLLPNGRVLLTGPGTTIAEVFDPVTNLSSLTGSMSLARSNFTATPLGDGTVLIAGGSVFASNVTTYLASAEIYNPAQGTFTPAPSPMTVARASHAATVLADGRVLISGGFSPNSLQSAEIYDPVNQTFTAVGNMLTFRNSHTGTLLANGQVLIAGGGTSSTTAELYNPITQTFSATPGGMVAYRLFGFTATRLADGRVLFVGGAGESSPAVRNTAEIYDPATGLFAVTGSMATARQLHTATLLADGSVLIAGGRSTQIAQRPLASLERFVPASGTFQPAGSMAVERNSHTATLVAGNRVVLAGSVTNGSLVAGPSAETYDPATVLALTGVPLANAQVGQVYPGAILGATGGTGPYTITMVSGSLPPGFTYIAASRELGVEQTPTDVGSYGFGIRVSDSAGHSSLHAVTLRVSPLEITSLPITSPVSGTPYNFTLTATGVGAVTWSIIGSLPTGLSLVGNTITGTATPVTGGSIVVRAVDSAGQVAVFSTFLSTQAPPADQVSNFDTAQPALTFGGATRLGQQVKTGITGYLYGVRAINLICPAGAVLTAELQGSLPNGAPNGVTIASGSALVASTFVIVPLSPQIFFAAEAPFALVFSTDMPCQVNPTTYDSYAGGDGYVSANPWQTLASIDGRFDIPFQTYVQPATGVLTTPRYRGNHTATTLADGRILLAGYDQSADVYTPQTGPGDGTFTVTGNMNVSRILHTATLLDDGTVLITGGYNFTGPGNTLVFLNSAEIYHPDTGLFELLPATFAGARYDHSATKLQNGQVLIAGGWGSVSFQSAYLYNPGTRTFTPIGNMQSFRAAHTATLLNDGRVLLDHGSNGNRSEIYDPVTGTFTLTSAPVVSFRSRHTATLMPNGTVFIAGGSGNPAATTSEIFNPVAGTFTNAGNLLNPRVDHTATLLNDGSVLLTGGLDDTAPCCHNIPPQASMERYVPGTGFVGAGSMLVSRYVHTASLLEDGTTLLLGTWGWSSLGGRSAEIYDPAAAVALASTAAPTGFNGLPYAGFTLSGVGGSGGPYAIGQMSGSLPSGLTYNFPTRSITGTPTQPGTFGVTFGVTDIGGHTNWQVLTVRIDPVVINTTSLPNGFVGIAYNQTLTGTGSGPLSWTLVPNQGVLPAGLTLNANGTITGTPQVQTSQTFTVRATDSQGQAAERRFTITIILG